RSDTAVESADSPWITSISTTSEEKLPPVRNSPARSPLLVVSGPDADPGTVKLRPFDVPPAVCTTTRPLVAPAGTDVWICVEDAEETVAAVPWKVTVFPAGVAAKAVPEIVTAVPT